MGKCLDITSFIFYVLLVYLGWNNIDLLRFLCIALLFVFGLEMIIKNSIKKNQEKK